MTLEAGQTVRAVANGALGIVRATIVADACWMVEFADGEFEMSLFDIYPVPDQEIVQ